MTHAEDIKRIDKTLHDYNKRAKIWGSTKTNSFHHEEEFIQFISLIPKNGSVIDIGCANGIHIPLFLGIGRHLTYFGIDGSRVFYETARRRYPQLDFALGDIRHRSSFPSSEKYDGFFMAATLMQLPLRFWSNVLSNIKSVCHPHAYGYITLPTSHPAGDKSDEDPRHFTILTEQEQIRQLTDMGAKIIHAGTKDGFYSKSIWKWYIVQLS